MFLLPIPDGVRCLVVAACGSSIKMFHIVSLTSINHIFNQITAESEAEIQTSLLYKQRRVNLKHLGTNLMI